jgi:hypothetical protein
MIKWSGRIEIRNSPEVVFDFLANIQNAQQSDDSPVRALDLITEGPPSLGSRYREIVRMMPFVEGEIISEITVIDCPNELELTWKGSGMSGTDRYVLDSIQAGTALKHTKITSFHGLLKIFEPIMRMPLIPRLDQRLVAIKRILEADAKRSP